MDWFSWLSRTNLEPLLVYEYGLSLTQNELEHQDIRYFNHEFLQSMGISIAKHRLEILKLARKEKRSSVLAPRSISRILIAIKKTKNCLVDYIRAWIHGEESSQALVVVPWSTSERSNASCRWKGAMLKRSKTLPIHSDTGFKQERLLLTNGTPYRLDSFSSSRVHHAEDVDAYWGNGLEEIKWDSMFQDLKPT